MDVIFHEHRLSDLCFACTVFGKSDNALSNSGFRTWKNLAHHLKEHEYSKGHCDNMTNEISALIGNKVLEEIVRRVHRAKYYSVIMDCTPDVSHKEQLSIVLRIVN